MLKELLSRLWKIRLVRFTIGGCLNMINRLIIAYLLQRAGCPVWANYALVHLFTLFFGYTYHTLFTFRQTIGFRGFRNFLFSVIGLRITDYVLVVGANQLELVREQVYSIPGVGEFLGDNLFLISIIIVSSIMFIIRYTLFRKVTFRDMEAQSPGLPEQSPSGETGAE